jgi:hypothetical protein
MDLDHQLERLVDEFADQQIAQDECIATGDASAGIGTRPNLQVNCELANLACASCLYGPRKTLSN